MKRNPPSTLLVWFSFVMPAQRHAERIGLLSGFKKMAPAAFFAEAMGLYGKYFLLRSAGRRFGEGIAR